ncbi:MAG TPA: M23 family metallopeptidase [Steroidobacteraceae bacterium]
MKYPLRLAWALVLLGSSPPTWAVAGKILPVEPRAEPTELGLAYNFDILVQNDENAALTLDHMRVEFLDARGALLLRKEISGNGSSPNLLMIPNRKLEPGEEHLYFNPFPRVPARLRVARVTARLAFSTPVEDAPPRTLELSAAVSSQPAPVVAMPIAGRVFVWDGHDELGHHRRWDYSIPFLKQIGFSSNGMRYSYDFVLVDERNEMSKADPKNNEDWLAFGIPVRAVEAGTVVKVVSTHPDDGSFDARQSLQDINALLGNYVVIDHGGGVFSAYAHLEQDSAQVRAGDPVRRGQRIAAVGNSGSANFPHLHFQLMNAPDMHGEGVPALFRDFERAPGADRVKVKQGPVDTGEVIIVK